MGTVSQRSRLSSKGQSVTEEMFSSVTFHFTLVDICYVEGQFHKLHLLWFSSHTAASRAQCQHRGQSQISPLLPHYDLGGPYLHVLMPNVVDSVSACKLLPKLEPLEQTEIRLSQFFHFDFFFSPCIDRLISNVPRSVLITVF